MRLGIVRHEFRGFTQSGEGIPPLPYESDAQDLPDYPSTRVSFQQRESAFLSLTQAALLDHPDERAYLVWAQWSHARLR